MTVARRSLLAGGTAGVGLVMAGAVPTLAEASPPTRRAPHPLAPPVPAADGRPGRHPRPAGRLPLPRRHPAPAQTQLVDGQGTTPSNHDGTAVFEAGATGCT